MRAIYLLGALTVAFSGVGCSTIASTFGFSPPVHKLSDSAEAIRTSQPQAAQLPTELNKQVLAAYNLEPGDTLAVEPAELESPVRLPGSQPVLPDGTIDLGKVGRPVVAGLTVTQAEAEVQRLVDKIYKGKADPDDATKDRALTIVTARLVGRESKVYYVLGEANAPRSFPLAGRETVLDGILAAGGITRQADTDKIVLSRPTQPEGCRIVLPICYLNIVQLGDTSTNYQLLPGDRIYIPSTSALDGLNFGHKKDKTKCTPCTAPQFGCPPGTNNVACVAKAGTPPTAMPSATVLPASMPTGMPAEGMPMGTMPSAMPAPMMPVPGL